MLPVPGDILRKVNRALSPWGHAGLCLELACQLSCIYCKTPNFREHILFMEVLRSMSRGCGSAFYALVLPSTVLESPEMHTKLALMADSQKFRLAKITDIAGGTVRHMASWYCCRPFWLSLYSELLRITLISFERLALCKKADYSRPSQVKLQLLLSQKPGDLTFMIKNFNNHWQAAPREIYQYLLHQCFALKLTPSEKSPTQYPSELIQGH